MFTVILKEKKRHVEAITAKFRESVAGILKDPTVAIGGKPAIDDAAGRFLEAKSRDAKALKETFCRLCAASRYRGAPRGK